MAMTERLFSEKNELIQFATRFLRTRIDSLQKDVAHCLKKPYAPFPAILYCFSTIDLLGALSHGDASKNPTEQSKNYMQIFINYTAEQSGLLQKLFRHKLVHLAEPRVIIKKNSQVISWRYVHEHDPEKHLLLAEEPRTIQITSIFFIKVSHVFNLSITDFANDIEYSIRKLEGYLHSLEKTPDLQDKFERAIGQIFDHE
jgi:hypothetical protein